VQARALAECQHKDGRALRCARASLRELGFDDGPVRKALNGVPPASVGPPDAALYFGRLAAPAPLQVLVRLFLLHERLGVEAVAPELGRHFARLVGAGLLGESDGHVRARLRIEPFAGRMVVSALADPYAARHGVVGVEPSTMTLASLTPRRRVDSVLDLGTGVGVQALLAAAHARTVTATDTNGAALTLAATNLALNAVDNVTLQQGSWYEPVDGHEFDLIVGNLPFAMAPAATSAFDHCIEQPCGDFASCHAVQGGVERLRRGGLAMFLCSWVVDEPGRWHERVARWLGSHGCDAVILRHGLQDATTYAGDHLHYLKRALPDEFVAGVTEWRRCFRDAEIRWIAWGAVALVRRAASEPGRILAFEHVTWPGAQAGDAVEALVGALRLLPSDTSDDDGFPLVPFVRIPGLRCSREPRPIGALPSDRGIVVERQGGAGIQVPVGEDALRFLDRLDEATPLRTAIGRQRLDGARAAALQRDVTSLVAAGFLVRGAR
jgi:SAM-dependent methyltransferase